MPKEFLSGWNVFLHARLLLISKATKSREIDITGPWHVFCQ